MLGSVFGVCETPGRFNHNLDAQRGPVDLSRIFRCENADLFIADFDKITFGLHVFFQGSERRVVLQQMCERFGVRQIVGGDELNFGIMQPGADDISPNAAKAVDTYLDWHNFILCHEDLGSPAPAPPSCPEWTSGLVKNQASVLCT